MVDRKAIFAHVPVLQRTDARKDGKQPVTVSGGLDSMVLWHLFHQLKLDYAVARQFQWEEKPVSGDENLSASTALKRAVLFGKTSGYQTSCHRARHFYSNSARNSLAIGFKNYCKEDDLNFLATAHHLNDSMKPP